MDTERVVPVAFRMIPSGNINSTYGSGSAPVKCPVNGGKEYGVWLSDMYNSDTGELLPLFPYYDEHKNSYEESLETLLFHELTHYNQDFTKNRPELKISREEELRFRNWREMDAILNENQLRKCCPEVKDAFLRAYYGRPQ